MLQGTIPAIPSPSQPATRKSSSRRALQLLDGSATLGEPAVQKELLVGSSGAVAAPVIDTTKEAGLAFLLQDAALGYDILLRTAMAPVQGALSSMQRLAKELAAADDDPDGGGGGGGGRGRLILQLSSGASCSGVGDLSQTPAFGSPIVSYTPPDVTCSSETITAETVIMANILGAVATTASAITAMQVRWHSQIESPVRPGRVDQQHRVCWIGSCVGHSRASIVNIQLIRKSQEGGEDVRLRLPIRAWPGFNLLAAPAFAPDSPVCTHVSCLTAFNSQASDSDMLSVMTGLNDKFDSTAALYSDHITSLNQAASVMYSNATQSLQVITTTSLQLPL